jgi:cyclase
VEWGEIRIAPPFLTFEERLNLYMDDLKVELIYVGPAHTTNDVIAWVPERKVLFTGDVIFNQGTPPLP